MSERMFDVDPANKLGNVDWEEDDDFSSFLDALNRGVAVRGTALPGETGAPADISLDEVAKLELRHLISRYQ
jgi:hypothetical protein